LNEDLLLQKYIPYAFFDHVHEIMELRFFLGATGEGLFPKAPAEGVFPQELLPISPFHFV